jgi:hypothetical protein
MSLGMSDFMEMHLERRLSLKLQNEKLQIEIP